MTERPIVVLSDEMLDLYAGSVACSSDEQPAPIEF
jgi:hypothetical protein